MSPVAGTVRAGTVPAGWWDVTLGPLDAGAVWLPGSTSAASGHPGALQRRAVATVHAVTGTAGSVSADLGTVVRGEAGVWPFTFGDALPATSATRTADGSDPVLGTDNLTFTLEDADAVPAVLSLVGLRWTASDGTVLQESVHRVMTARATDLPGQVPGAITVSCEHWLAWPLRTSRVPLVAEGGLHGAIAATRYHDGVGILVALLEAIAGACGTELDLLDPIAAGDLLGSITQGWSDPLPPQATYGEVAAYCASAAYSVCEVVYSTTPGFPVVRARHVPHLAAGLVVSTSTGVGGMRAVPAEDLQLQATLPAVTDQRHRIVRAPNPTVVSAEPGLGGAETAIDGTWSAPRFLPRTDRLATLEWPWSPWSPAETEIVYWQDGTGTADATPWCAVQVQEACGSAEQLTLPLDSAYPVPVMGEWVRIKVDLDGRHLDGWYAVRGWTQPTTVAAGSWTLAWRQDGG